MTLQDDMARPWFQPVVPTEQAPQERAQQARAQQERARPDAGRRDEAPATDDGNAGPLTTRVAGELPLDELAAPVPRSPGVPPAPERVEVTQPYIPAIRDQQPSFAKRLQPDPQPAPPTATPPTTATPSAPPAREPGTVTTEPVAQPAGPGAPTTPTDTVAAPRKDAPETSRESQARTGPPKRRSLARRVVRAIIGPDLLRKDPPRKK